MISKVLKVNVMGHFLKVGITSKVWCHKPLAFRRLRQEDH
jgi:hypothetical protein